jgi:DNA-binding transcriptional regulator YiaG
MMAKGRKVGEWLEWNLKKSRKEESLSQRELSRRSGIFHNTIAHWEILGRVPAEHVDVLKRALAGENSETALKVRLNKFREDTRTSVPVIARALGVSERTVSNWFSGTSLPSCHFKNLLEKFMTDNSPVAAVAKERPASSGDVSVPQKLVELFVEQQWGNKTLQQKMEIILNYEQRGIDEKMD